MSTEFKAVCDIVIKKWRNTGAKKDFGDIAYGLPDRP